MNTTSQINWRYWALISGFTAVALVTWHLAVVVTTSASVLDPKAGLASLKAGFRPTTLDVEAPRQATVIIWVLLLVSVIAIEEVIAFKHRQRGNRTEVGKLASGRTLQKTMAPKKDTPVVKAFAYLDGRPLTLRTEDNGAVVAPPRIGKSMYIAVPLIADAPGAVVTTSTKPDVLRLTAGIRSKIGTVTVFDPEGVSLWPDSIQWDIVAGCADAEEAAERSTALVSSRDVGDERNASFFQEAADTVLRCLLHAAALKPGGNMRDVVRWARDFDIDEPYDILRDHPGAVTGWVVDLTKFCRGKADETVSSTDMSLGLVLRSFALPRILDAVCPAYRTGFDPTSFYEKRDTLYLLSRSGKTSLSAPIFTALVTAIERRARLKAGHTATGRIDPPLSLILDEVANTAPIRDLDSLMADGGGRGVIAWPFAQSRAQLAKRYGTEDAKTILDSASVFVMLAGSKDVDHLREVSALAGKTKVVRESHSTSTGPTGSSSTQRSFETEDLMPPEKIRTIGIGRGYMLYRDAAPAVADLVPWWERPDRADFEASMRWVLGREGLKTDSVTTNDFVRQVIEDNKVITSEGPVT